MKLWIILLVSNVPRTIRKKMMKKTKMIKMNSVQVFKDSVVMARMDRVTQLEMMMGKRMTMRVKLNTMKNHLILHL